MAFISHHSTISSLQDELAQCRCSPRDKDAMIESLEHELSKLPGNIPNMETKCSSTEAPRVVEKRQNPIVLLIILLMVSLWLVRVVT